MATHSRVFKSFFDSCEEKDSLPLFADFIKRHSQYLKDNLSKNQASSEEYDKLSGAFFKYAKSRGIEAKKGSAKSAWEIYILQQADDSLASTATIKTSMVLCQGYGEEEEVYGRWSVGGEDLIKAFNNERRRVVELVKSKKFIKESQYLLLSYVLELPVDSEKFCLEVKNFKKIRKELIPITKKKQYEHTILLMFINLKKRWEIEQEEAEEDDDDNDEEDEDSQYLQYQLARYAKKSKKEEEVALSRVLREMLDLFENWRTECKTEEDFIDQALYPFLRHVILQDKRLSSTRSYGKIPCNHDKSDTNQSKNALATTSNNTSSTLKSISKAKPDFFVFLSDEADSFGLLCVEVKKPGAKQSQVLSDRSKLALECKRSIDHQVSLGVRRPKCFALVVNGEVCSSFVCELTLHSIYTFVELEVFSLPRGKMDLGSLPDTILSFCWLKELIDDQISSIYKRRKTSSSGSSGLIVKPTVALPIKKGNMN